MNQDTNPPQDGVKLRSKTFRDHSVCKAALVWKCPTQLFHSAKRSTSARPCKLDHDPYYKQQYEDAIQQYIVARQRAEPEWNPDNLPQGDPWGYMFDNLEALEVEISAIEHTRVQAFARPEVFRPLDVDDVTYNALYKQIRELYRRLDPLLDDTEEAPPVEAVTIIEQIQQLEAELMKLFSTLVQAQVAVLLRYYERRRACENDLRSEIASGIGSDKDEEGNLILVQNSEELVEKKVNEKVPLPPCVIDIEQFTPFRFSSKPDAEFYASLSNLEQQALRAVNGFKMQVCDICCGILNLHDEFRRFSDHVCGRAHLTFRDVRAQILRYTTLIKPLANPQADVKPHLIHPWTEWAQRFQPRSEFEIKAEQEEIAQFKHQQYMLSFLKQFRPNNNYGTPVVSQYRHEQREDPQQTGMTDELPAAAPVNSSPTPIISPPQSYLADTDCFLLDPAITLAMESISTANFALNPASPPNPHPKHPPQHQHHHAYDGPKFPGPKEDFHVSEEDAFRGTQQLPRPHSHHSHPKSYNSSASYSYNSGHRDRDRDRPYHHHHHRH